jgi:hypothetical protein
MGKIILTVEGTTVGTVSNGGGIVIEKTVSEEDSARLLQAYAAIYADRWVDAEGTPFQPTYEQIIQAWWNGIVDGSVSAVRNQEATVAAKQAAEAVTDISVT